MGLALAGCASLSAQTAQPAGPPPTLGEAAQTTVSAVAGKAGHVAGFFRNTGVSLANGTVSGFKETQGKKPTGTGATAPPTAADQNAHAVGKTLGHVGGFFHNLGKNVAQSAHAGYQTTQDTDKK